jgi:SAM-dependent methyltransferase
VLPTDDEDTPPSRDRIATALRSGVCPSDSSFDRFLPPREHRAAPVFWTPLVVALRVARWLEPLGIRSVLDVGSGAGKFCVAASLASGDRPIRFTGLEQRSRLVHVAKGLARSFGVAERVDFVEGTLADVEPASYEAYYLFNPFGENLFGPEDHLDGDVELSPARYERDVAVAEGFFDRAPVGSAVLTYNGFGGRMPPTYDEVRVNRHLPNVLRMYRKVREHREEAR